MKTPTMDDALDIAVCFGCGPYDIFKREPCNRRGCYDFGSVYVVNRSAVGRVVRPCFDQFPLMYRFLAARDEFGDMEFEAYGNIMRQPAQFDVYVVMRTGGPDWAFLELLTPIRSLSFVETEEHRLHRRVVFSACLYDGVPDAPEDPVGSYLDELGYDWADPAASLHLLPFPLLSDAEAIRRKHAEVAIDRQRFSWPR